MDQKQKKKASLFSLQNSIFPIHANLGVFFKHRNYKNHFALRFDWTRETQRKVTWEKKNASTSFT